MKKKANDLAKALQDLAKQGIQADVQRLKHDMCSQFADPREWIREYVVNAYDAGATFCSVFGNEGSQTLRIYVRDNGHGMNRERLVDFFTLYRSVKIGDATKMVGKHGIGKLSVAAIPGQSGFAVMTSDGKEAWRAITGSLLEEKPIELEQLAKVPETGSEFCIEFKKSVPLREEMLHLLQILKTFVRYLPLTVQVYIPEDALKNIPGQWETFRSDWEPFTETFGKSYHIQLGDSTFDMVLSLDESNHEIYQNRVFVTNRYNLVSIGQESQWQLPHLHIRVDCRDFELPFGRHCLRNEEILPPLAATIRQRILPDYFRTLAAYYMRADSRSAVYEIEELAMALNYYQAMTGDLWTEMPLFRLVQGGRLSLNELREKVNQQGKLYLARADEPGADYTLFDGPVLSGEQMPKGLDVINQLFKNELINLQQQDVVIEAPADLSPELSDAEKNFAAHLGFHPQVLAESDSDAFSENKGSFSHEDMERLTHVRKEMQNASQDIQDIRWRVHHLVERDGKTPCMRHRFMVKGNDVILNLYHPDIKQLVELSRHMPALAGHWAVAMCISENSTLLPHITRETREDLLLIDAMAKLTEGSLRPRPNQNASENGGKDRAAWEFVRSANDWRSLSN